MKLLVFAGLAVSLAVAGAADAKTRHAPRQAATRTTGSQSSNLATSGLNAGGYDGLGDTLTFGGGRASKGGGSTRSTGGKSGGGDLSGSLGGGRSHHGGGKRSKGGL